MREKASAFALADRHRRNRNSETGPLSRMRFRSHLKKRFGIAESPQGRR
jgi:hypothetical protein